MARKRGLRPLTVLLLLALLFIFWVYQQRRRPTPIPEPSGESVHLLLGNPSNAVADSANANNYLNIRPQYAMSYNREKGGPNWVSWHLAASDLGDVDRCDCFAPDALLPSGWQIRPNDYQGSGYDRGHLCPSGDRTDSRDNNAPTFVMSNMLPQTAELNRHVWEKLESYSRSQVKAGDELYIIAGGYGEQERIKGKVVVPTHCWKIVLSLPEGQGDLSRIDEDTRVIAVDIPNEKGIEADTWQKYIVTVNDLERSTGYRFFTALPPNLQTALKAKRDAGRKAPRTRALAGLVTN
jgi:endonuclease G, mitochondrial